MVLGIAESIATPEISAELNSAREKPDEIDKSSWNEGDDRRQGGREMREVGKSTVAWVHVNG